MNQIRLIISILFIFLSFLLKAQNTDTTSVFPSDLVVPDTSIANKPESSNDTSIENTNSNPQESGDSLISDTSKTITNSINFNDTFEESDSLTESEKENISDFNNINSSELLNEYKDTIIVKFINDNTLQSPDSLYFNILKISNFTKKKISGELTFTFPDGWNIISAQGNVLELLADDSAFIPVRLALNKESVGALSYILNATFKVDGEMFSTNAYITIPGYSIWTISLNKSLVYFNEYNESESVKLKLSNKGNVTETIKLEYKIGNLLKSEDINNNVAQYITLSSNKDSIITINVISNNDLSFNDRKLYERNWKEASLEIKASSLDKTMQESIWFKKLYSSYINNKMGYNSPLNIGINCSNLLSEMYLKFNTELFGQILLPKDRDIYYRFNIYGIGVQNKTFNNFNFNRQSSILINYHEKNLNVSLGDNVGGGVGVGFSGRGVRIQYRIDKTSSVSGGVMMSRFIKNSYGGFLRYNKTIFNIGLRAGIGIAKREIPKSTLLSATLGGSYSIFRNNFSVDLFGTNLNIVKNNDISSSQLSQDTTLIGFGYALGYSFTLKKFDIIAKYQNYLKSVTNIGNIIDIKSRFNFNKNKRIDLIYNRRKVTTSNYFQYAFLRPTYYINEYARAVLNIPTNRSVTFGIGPYYTSNINQSFDRNKLYMQEIITYNPKLYLTANIRLKNYKSIAAFLTVGYSQIRYKTENPSKNNISILGKGNYTFGSSYNTKVWRLSVSYNIGSVTDLWYYINYLSEYPGYKPKYRNTESIVIRPSYEKSFYEDRILVQFMASYSYYIPSKRENLSLALSTFFNLSRGWSASLNANIYFNAVEDEESGRQSTKSLNLQIGVRKSFGIQQPRIKFYDLTIVCFKDLNGNKIKDENEPPLPNIQVTFERTVSLNDSDEVSKINTGFAEIELITSPDGQVYYGNIPEGVYFVNFKPLSNLKDLYNVNGDQQTIRISSNNTTYFVPFAETYKVKGKVIIERDEFSSEGSLSFEGIRVTATDPNGESYSVLTDKNGDYMLSVPQAQTYKVKVNQVFNDQFICERGEYNVHFNGIKVINLDFKFYEKKRKVNFDSAIDALYIFNSLNTTSSKTKLGKEGFKTDIDTSNVLRYVDQILDTNEKLENLFPVSNVTDTGIIFKIDLYPPTNKRLTKDQVTLPSVICIEENNLYRYFANTFQNYQDAKDYLEEIQDLGVSTAKIVSFKDGKEISSKEAGVDNE